MLIQENLSIQEKLRILTAAAKYDGSCTSSGVGRKRRAHWEVLRRPGSATVLLPTAGASLFLRSCLPINAYMTANTALTAVRMTRCGHPLHRRRCAALPWNFTGEIISKVCF